MNSNFIIRVLRKEACWSIVAIDKTTVYGLLLYTIMSIVNTGNYGSNYVQLVSQCKNKVHQKTTLDHFHS